MSRKQLPKINQRVMRSGSGYKNSQDFTDVIFSGNHPDDRSDDCWLHMMKKKGFKDIDKTFRN